MAVEDLVIVNTTDTQIVINGNDDTVVVNPDPEVITLEVLKGEKGDTGPANALTIGTVGKTAPGGNPTVSLTGTSPSQVINFTLPTGDTGPANTLSVGSVTTLTPGSTATASITGTAPNQTLNLGIPAGAKILQGSTDPAAGTGVVGDWYINVSTWNMFEKTGASAWTNRFNIRGATGPSNTLSIGSVTTGAVGTSASATITGASPSQTLNLTLPTGATGPAPNLSIGSVSASAPGSNPVVTIGGSNPNYSLNFTLPTGPTVQWLSGSGAPAGGTGAVNDWYIVNQGTVGLGDVYKKTGASTWTLQGNIRGAAGNGSVNAVNNINPNANGNVTLSAANVGAIPMNSAIFPMNPWSGKKLQSTSLENALFRAESRWTVVATRHNATTDAVTHTYASAATFFNGNYDEHTEIPAGEYLKVSIDFNGVFPAYPYGNVFISHYYTARSASAKLRVYSTFEAHGIGWHEIPFGVYEDSSASQYILSAYNGKYGINKMEVIVWSKPSEVNRITQLDFLLERPGTVNEMPYVDKYRTNAMYSSLLWGSMVNPKARINIDGSASFTGQVAVDGSSLVKTNDPRLSDARPPTTHGHALTDANITGILPIAQVPTGTSSTTVALGNHGHALTDANITGIIPDVNLPPALRSNGSSGLTDWNVATRAGWYHGNNAANAPSTGWFMGDVVVHDSSPGNLYVTQTVHGFTAATAADTYAFRRHAKGGTGNWTSWYRLRMSETELDARYAMLTGNQTIAGTKTFSNGIITSALRLNTAPVAGYTLSADVNGNASWTPNAIMADTKLGTDNASTYTGGLTISTIGAAQVWPTDFSTALTVFSSVNRAFQIHVDKVTTKTSIRSGDAATTNGWTPWREVFFLDGPQTVSGATTFSNATTITGSRLTLSNASPGADGVVITSTDPGAESPRLFLSPGTTGRATSFRTNSAGSLTIGTNGTPGLSSGTTAVVLDANGNVAFTGTATAATPTASGNLTTKSYVDGAIANLVNSAPGTLDTLNELATALGNDPNFATTVTNNIASKVSLGGNETISGIKTFSGNILATGPWTGINAPTRIGTIGSAGAIMFARGNDASFAGKVGYADATNFTDFVISATGGGSNIQFHTGGTLQATIANNGATTFVNTVSAATPTAAGHLTTKAYVDTGLDSKIGPMFYRGVSTNTSSTGQNLWTRVLSLRLPVQYADASTLFRIIGAGSGMSMTNAAEVAVRLKQQNVMGAAPTGSVIVEPISSSQASGAGFDEPARWRLIVVTQSATETIAELYFQAPGGWEQYSYQELITSSSSGGTVSWFSNQGYLATGSLPTGVSTIGGVSGPYSKKLQDDLNSKSPSNHGHALTDSNITGILPVAQLPSTVFRTDVAQTVTAASTFTGAVIVPTPTATTHATTKAYVDTAVGTKQDTITAGTTAQYFRGDKTWQTIQWGDISGRPADISAYTYSAQSATSQPASVTVPSGTEYVKISTYNSARSTQNVSLTLPDPATNPGRSIYIYREDSVSTGALGRTLTVNSTAMIANQKKYVFVSNGSSWEVQAPTEHTHIPSEVGLSNVTNAAQVDLTSAQTIAGVKTFSNQIVVNNTNGVIIDSTYDAAFMSEIGGELVNFGTNYWQTNRADTTHAGALFRIDTRPAQHGAALFQVLWQPVPGSGETIPFKVGSQGNVIATGRITGSEIYDGANRVYSPSNAPSINQVVNLQSELNSRRIVVNHGTNNAFARPTGAVLVEWVGSVQPTNMANGDTWINTAG